MGLVKQTGYCLSTYPPSFVPLTGITDARDRCMFKYIDCATGDVAYVTLYVDDFLFAGSADRVLDHIINQLQ